MDVELTKGAESGLDRGGESLPSAPGSTAPGLKSPQWSAERRASVTTEVTRLARRVGRLRQPSRRPRKPPRFSALRSLKGAQDGRRRTRRRKEYGRRSVGYLKFESDDSGDATHSASCSGLTRASMMRR